MRTVLRLLLATFTILISTGCASNAQRHATADYTLVYLVTGPGSASHTKEDRQTIFQGHMANMNKLAEAGDLVIAGPFGRPRDKSWRGIQVFNTGDQERAHSLAKSDPGISSEEFSAILVPMRASEALRETLRVDREATANLPKPASGETPMNIRGYVMLTAEDADRCLRAIEKSPTLAGQIVWWGRLADDRGRYTRGIFVLDATDADAVARELEGQPGIGVDAWYSTASLPGLPAGAREWR